jgi:antibiotic biosynthesis monooxygenase (ABM) superfamily enzyme
MTRHVLSQADLKSRVRSCLIVFVAAWPTIMLLQAALGPLIATWSNLWQAGLLCALMAPLLTFVVCPVIDRVLRLWD